MVVSVGDVSPQGSRLCGAQSRNPLLQAGLLTFGSLLCRCLPILSRYMERTVAIEPTGSPITVALPRRNYTAFPIKPLGYLKRVLLLLSCYCEEKYSTTLYCCQTVPGHGHSSPFHTGKRKDRGRKEGGAISDAMTAFLYSKSSTGLYFYKTQA